MIMMAAAGGGGVRIEGGGGAWGGLTLPPSTHSQVHTIHSVCVCILRADFILKTGSFLTSCPSQSVICALGEKTYLERRVLLPVVATQMPLLQVT